MVEEKPSPKSQNHDTMDEETGIERSINEVVIGVQPKVFTTEKSAIG